MSEIIAQHASNNRIKRCNYVPRDKWDSNYLNNLDKDLQDSYFNNLNKDLDYFDNNFDFHTDVINDKLGMNDYGRFVFTIEYSVEKGKIWDLWLIMNNNIYENYEEINRQLANITISIYIGGSPMTIMDMRINLFFASLLNKKIIYEEDKIYIPIILELLYPKKFPLYLLQYHKLEIFVDLHKKISCPLELKYNWCKSKNMNKSHRPFDICSLHLEYRGSHACIKEYSKLNANIHGPVQILLFEVDKIVNEYCYPILQTIELSLCNEVPIVFRTDMGEIIKVNILGKNMYIISLCSKFKYKDDIKKIFFKDKCTEYELPEGINFSGINKIDFNLQFDVPFIGSIKLYTLNNNYLRFYGGMAGLAFAT